MGNWAYQPVSSTGIQSQPRVDLSLMAQAAILEKQLTESAGFAERIEAIIHGPKPAECAECPPPSDNLDAVFESLERIARNLKEKLQTIAEALY